MGALTAARAAGAERYATCLAGIEADAAAAFETAIAWRDEGGGFPARHCVALALIRLGHRVEAANRLEVLAEDMRAAGQPLVAEVLGQAGNAWLLGGEPGRALAVFDAAMALEPSGAELLVDRARAQAALGDYGAAAADLDRALTRDPDNADALAYRAAARRRLGRQEEAAADLERALWLAPRHPEALLERGLLNIERGDRAAARRDLIEVRMVAPQSAAAEVAGANLERLDVNPE
jgi:tetratricopeptide (TPR) repeat protein